MKKPETDPQAAGQEPVERPRRAARKPGVEEYHIYFLPEGKGGQRERKGSVPLDVDPFDAIEERTDLEPGLYRVEKRKGGEFAKEVCHYTKEEDTARTVTPAQDDDDDELPIEYTPTPNAPDDDARIAKLVASTVSTVLDARDRRERAATGQPDPMDQFRQMRQLLKEEREEMQSQMRELLPKQNPASQEPAVDDKTRAELYFLRETRAIPEMVKGLRDVLSAPERIDEPQSWTDKLLDFAKEFVPYIGPVAGPIIGQRLIGLLGQMDDAALMQAAGMQPAQPQQHPAYSPPQAYPSSTTVPAQAIGDEEESTLVTFEGVLEGIITDLQEGNEPAEAIDDTAKLTSLQPTLLPVIAKMMGQPNAQLVQMLSEAKGVDLTHLLNADEYIDALRDGLKKRIRLPELPAASVPTNNGHGTPATAKT